MIDEIIDILEHPAAWASFVVVFLGLFLLFGLSKVKDCEDRNGVAVHGTCIKKECIAP